jgi:hypothetical protein
MQLIKNEGTKVELRYSDRPDFLMKMDFGPIIRYHKLTGNFVIVHFQAMPKGERRWGVFDGATQQYYSVRDTGLDVWGGVSTKYVSIPEVGFDKPTSAVLHLGAITVEVGPNDVRIQPA